MSRLIVFSFESTHKGHWRRHMRDHITVSMPHDMAGWLRTTAEAAALETGPFVRILLVAFTAWRPSLHRQLAILAEERERHPALGRIRLPSAMRPDRIYPRLPDELIAHLSNLANGLDTRSRAVPLRLLVSAFKHRNADPQRDRACARRLGNLFSPEAYRRGAVKR